VILAAVCSLAAGVGCKTGGSAPSDALTLLPRESSIVFSLNLARLRGSKLWANVTEVRNDPSTKKDYDEFVQKTGLDPLAQINRVVGGVPTDTLESKEAAIIVQGTFDEGKIVSYAKEKQKANPQKPELKIENYGGRSIYGTGDEMQMAFLDSRTMVFAGKSWMHKVIDLCAGKGDSVSKNDGIQALVKKAKTDAALWGVGQVPAGKAPLPTGGEIRSIAANFDFASGLNADVFAEAPNADDAKKLTEEMQRQFGQVKQNPMLAATGIGPLIEGAKLSTEGSSLHVAVALNPQQLEDVANRLKGMIQMFRAFGGAPGMGGEKLAPPPGAPGEPAPGIAPPEAPPAPSAPHAPKKPGGKH
jgi:hypothetical protein